MTGGRNPMDQFTAHLDRGWDLLSRGDLPGALLSAQKGLELDGESPDAHNLIGYVHAAEGNAEDALSHYRQAIDLDDCYVEAMLNAADILLHPLADYDGALSMVEDALELIDEDHELADALLLKADVLMQGGDEEGARRVIRTIPDGPFESPNLEFLIGRALFDLGNDLEAEPRIRAAVSADPLNPEAQYYLGLMLDKRGDKHGATIAFLQTRELEVRIEPPPWGLPADQFEKRVQAAVEKLPEEMLARLRGALIHVSDLPGPEVVAEGVDPRISVLVDLPPDGTDERPLYVFVYQRNVERMANSVIGIEDEIMQALVNELRAGDETNEPSPP